MKKHIKKYFKKTEYFTFYHQKPCWNDILTFAAIQETSHDFIIVDIRIVQLLFRPVKVDTNSVW